MTQLNRRTLAALLALMLLIALIGATLWATNALGWRRWRIQEIEAFIGAALPGAAADVQFATENTEARIVWLRFTLPARADLDAFITALSLPIDLRQGFTPFPAPNPVEAPLTWWTPHSATAYSGFYGNSGEKIIELLADESTPGSIIVYLRAYAL